jgi:uncharacterized protein (DUF1800 family)
MFRLAIAALAVVTLDAGVTAQRSAVPIKAEDKAILHVLNRIGFGPRPGDIERVREQGLAAYIDRQLRPDTIRDVSMDARLAPLDTLRLSSRELASEYFAPALAARREANARPAPETMTMEAPARTPEQIAAARRSRRVLLELSAQKILRAAFSERQLEEVMVDFWFNHFNVFAGKGATMNHVTSYERDAIRPHAFGKFRDLLGATAKSPAMLFYLDNWQSATPAHLESPALSRRRAQGEGGRRMLAMEPPRQRRGLNENYGRELMELHTLGVDGGYTQQDVVNVARAFTGWTIDRPRLGGGFRFEERLHDSGEKVVLGHTIRAGGGQSDGERVLDILASHPSTATFLATKLARRFVADAPPPALVSRAAARFRDTGGDIREVLRTMLTSPEFFAPDAYRAKVKTPFEFVVSAVRATGTDVAEAEPLVQAVRQLGMPLYMCQPPTGYADRADAWVNTGALLNRMNFALQLVGGRMRGIRSGSAAPGFALGGAISAATAATIAKATEPGQSAALTLGSPEFQRK